MFFGNCDYFLFGCTKGGVKLLSRGEKCYIILYIERSAAIEGKYNIAFKWSGNFGFICGEKMKNKGFFNGVTDGLPICFGYLSVAFAFGVFASANGIPILGSILISMTNVTSAGQLAAVPIIASGGTLIELAASQAVINLRYALMSVSLSQKFDGSVRIIDRLIISFVNTDEVFAVVAGKKGSVGRSYMYGLILTPFLGWSAGTAVGAAAGDVLPPIIISSLGVAIYGMFIAIVTPQMRTEKPVVLCVAAAVILSCAFKFIPLLQKIPQGFVIIICAVAASVPAAILFPVPDEDAAPDPRNEVSRNA